MELVYWKLEALLNPRHAVGSFAGLEAAGDGEGLQIDHRDVVVAVDGDVGPGAIRRQQNPFDHLAERDVFRDLARGDADDGHPPRLQAPDPPSPSTPADPPRA